MEKKTVSLVTTTRAEFGIMEELIKELQADEDIIFKLIVTGTHLSQDYGNTIDNIKNSGIKIDFEIPIISDLSGKLGVSQTFANTVAKFSEHFQSTRIDLLIILGDRFEALAIASAATIYNIPIAHIHGGEVTKGAIDDSFRHAITKMSYLHFASTEEYRKRIIQLGESPDRVFNVGSLGVEKINDFEFLDKKEILKLIFDKYEFQIPSIREKFLNISNYAVVLYQPETISHDNPTEQVKLLLETLDECDDDISYIVIGGNTDAGGKEINDFVRAFSMSHERFSFFISFESKDYLSLLKNASFLIGNSSSGIIEMPSFNKPTINIGNRQAQRVRAESVIDIGLEKNEILDAISKSLSLGYNNYIKSMNNPYRKEGTKDNIVRLVKHFLYEEKIDLQKSFYDISF